MPLAEWRKERIERLVKPTESQRKALDDLQAASSKAAQIVITASEAAAIHLVLCMIIPPLTGCRGRW